MWVAIWADSFAPSMKVRARTACGVICNARRRLPTTFPAA